MKIVMTLMVRDEADIVGAMLEHHFAQGVDHMVVTDNGSVDGTLEILQRYADDGRITLHQDPRHEKQQAAVVTRMAREAADQHGATWVLNADADEFWVAENHQRTLREALSEIPTRFNAFPVPVVDMTGDPALTGSGIDRLTLRDARPVSRINELGLHAHATPDVAFVASSDVEVVQGNHFVNLESHGAPEPGAGIEVLHLPWRSWSQFSTKVRNAGLAYERSNLTPSPNHHGMRDYQRLLAGSLFPLYLARHPGASEREAGRADTLVEDRRLAEALQSPVPDEPVSPDVWEALSDIAPTLVAQETRLRIAEQELSEVERQLREAESRNQTLAAQNREFAGQIGLVKDPDAELLHRVRELQNENAVLRGSKVFRLAHKVGRYLPGRG